VHLSIFISVFNRLDAQTFCFTISLFHASTCFEYMCSSSGGQNCITQPLVSSHLHYTASGIITPTLHSLWYHHTYITQPLVSSHLHYTASGIIKPTLHSLWYHQTYITQHLVSSHLHYTASGIITPTLHSLWYHHTYITQHLVSSHLHYTASGIIKPTLHSLWYHHTYRCDDTRGCVMQFWPPHDEHMCSIHVEAWNIPIVRRKVCASSWLITEINDIYVVLLTDV